MAISKHNTISPQWLALYFPQRVPQDLNRLAGWSYQYTSQVCICPEQHTLLLEIGASQRLFGKARTLTERICSELEQLGYSPKNGIAPTPEAAHIAARYGLHIPTRNDIHKSIGKLDIDCLQLQENQLQTLKKMGFRKTGEIFRLPRKALARRMGMSFNNYLDRLLGLCPDPHKTFQPQAYFSASADLPETAHTSGLIFPLRRLIQELCGILRARDCAIQSLEVKLSLRKGRQTFHLTLQQPTRSESHLMMLLRGRLERLPLSQPVRCIHLRAEHFLPFAAHQEALLPTTDTTPPIADNTVLERLQARLGMDAIKGLNGHQDHRPEHSWAIRELDEPVSCTPLPQRPAWLLPNPQRCRIHHYRILAGPERIESGWWDGNDCRRDYFIVRDSNGSTLWAFHEYKPHPGWYLHGLFA